MKPVTLQSAPRCRKWWGGSAWSAFWVTQRSRSSAELGRDGGPPCSDCHSQLDADQRGLLAYVHSSTHHHALGGMGWDAVT
jgi:hypothetical protein